MSKLNAVRGQELLASLGSNAQRPAIAPPKRGPQVALCRNCSQQVTLAPLPSGSMAKLDAAPNGPLLLADGCAVERDGDGKRFTWHRCEVRR